MINPTAQQLQRTLCYHLVEFQRCVNNKNIDGADLALHLALSVRGQLKRLEQANPTSGAPCPTALP